jgi:hypothetical protein
MSTPHYESAISWVFRPPGWAVRIRELYAFVRDDKNFEVSNPAQYWYCAWEILLDVVLNGLRRTRADIPVCRFILAEHGPDCTSRDVGRHQFSR